MRATRNCQGAWSGWPSGQPGSGVPRRKLNNGRYPFGPLPYSEKIYASAGRAPPRVPHAVRDRALGVACGARPWVQAEKMLEGELLESRRRSVCLG